MEEFAVEIVFISIIVLLVIYYKHEGYPLVQKIAAIAIAVIVVIATPSFWSGSTSNSRGGVVNAGFSGAGDEAPTLFYRLPFYAVPENIFGVEGEVIEFSPANLPFDLDGDPQVSFDTFDPSYLEPVESDHPGLSQFYKLLKRGDTQVCATVSYSGTLYRVFDRKSRVCSTVHVVDPALLEEEPEEKEGNNPFVMFAGLAPKVPALFYYPWPLFSLIYKYWP